MDAAGRMPNADRRRPGGAALSSGCNCEALIRRERRRAAAAAAMGPTPDSLLDVAAVYHSTAVPASEGPSCGCLPARPEPTAVLRDVSARVFGGEVLAVLGSKGSGKRALLDVIGECWGGGLPVPKAAAFRGGFMAGCGSFVYWLN